MAPGSPAALNSVSHRGDGRAAGTVAAGKRADLVLLDADPLAAIGTVVTLLGAGAKAVSMYAREDTCHALVTYSDRMPAEIWFGRPNERWEYCHTSVFFAKRRYEFTPAIEGDFWYGHHYEMYRMAAAFRDMVRTRAEPVPHAEILAVTGVVRAAAKSLAERSRLVDLAEVADRWPRSVTPCADRG